MFARLAMVSAACWFLSCSTEVGDVAETDEGDLLNEPDSYADVAPAPRRRLEDGHPCETGDDCLGGTCLRDPQWPEGYCTALDCELRADCGALARCQRFAGRFACLHRCNTDSSCREGFYCYRTFGDRNGVCLPGQRGIDGEDGAPCSTSADCASDTCVGVSTLGRYCLTEGCETGLDCPRSGDVCHEPAPGQSRCYMPCTVTTDCRAGFTCAPLIDGQGLCTPGWMRPLREDLDFSDDPLGIVCQNAEPGQRRFEIQYEVHDDAIGYSLTIFTRDGRGFLPRALRLPGALEVDFMRENRFQLRSLHRNGTIVTLVVPPTPAHAWTLRAGRHTLTVDSDSDSLCWYRVERHQPGRTLDISLHLVGVPGIDAESAATDADLQVMVEQVALVLGQVGVSIGRLRYLDGDPRSSIIRSTEDTERVAESAAPFGSTLSDRLALHLYLVRGITYQEGVLGFALALPGPPGLHGTPFSGVVVSAEYLRTPRVQGVSGARYVGTTVAHEIGHFLGLMHTSSINLAEFDPLDDTPECDLSPVTSTCPDANNLMFPYAIEGATGLTAGQGFQMKAHPLVQ